MTRNSILIFTLLFSVIFNAQYRINYTLALTYPDKTEKKFSMNLDIDQEFSSFYDEDILKEKRSNSKSNQFVFHKLNSDEYETIVNTPDNIMFSIKSTNKIVWNLQNEFKTIEKYKLQKATTNFGERDWIAWFSPDVNISEGPFKFRGLPGLIFELSDSENIFIYKLTTIEKLTPQSQKLKFDLKNTPKITWEKYNKNLTDFYENPFNKERMLLSKGNEINFDNKDISLQDLNNMTKDFQDRIKLSFPPAIELNNFTFYKSKILGK